jgi:4-amino-4-deoxy-L-arabinose transferase-like glycosyltransferase
MQDASGSPIKTEPNIKDWINPILVGSFIILFSLFFLRDIQEIPFHPDEATQIFMSSDVDLFMQDPSSLIWKPQNPMDIRIQYRLLDAPFSRTWIGIFRALGRVPELPNDWNWSSDWGQNIKAGAYPTEAQLITGRLASAIFLPLDILFLYLIGRKLRGNLLGWLMVLLFSLNALILLHTRRAMSEGPMLFFIILSIWSFLQNPRFLFLSAIPVALAFNTKYSALPLFILGLFALIYRNYPPKMDRNRLIMHIAVYFIIFLGMTYFLNPFLWEKPYQAFIAATVARKALLARQVADLESISQGWISNTISKRFGSILANLFLTPPAFHDVGNYIENTMQSELKYQALSVQNLFRGLSCGIFSLILSAMGFILGSIHTRLSTLNKRELLIILLLGSILQFIFILLVFSIPFQRYVLPLIPFSILWVAYAINELFDIYQKKKAA